MKRFLLSLFFALVAVASWAYDVEIDGIYYNIIKKAMSAEVTRRDYSFFYKGDIVIPSSIEVDEVTYAVTSIGNDTFYCCSRLTSITIPNSVTSIGAQAFSECGIASITIPNTVTNIGAHAFLGCDNLTSVTIPNSVIKIGYGAFSGCIYEA